MNEDNLIEDLVENPFCDQIENPFHDQVDLHLLNDRRKGNHPQRSHGSWSSKNPFDSKRAKRLGKAVKKSIGNIFAKPVIDDDDDPFADDPFAPDPEDPEAKHEAGLLKKLEKEERSRFHSIIHEAGGIKTRPDLREEYSQVPNTFKRKDGLPGDEMAEYIAMYYPEFGIEDERDLIDYLAA